MARQKKKYTESQLGTLLEDQNSKMDAIFEYVKDLPKIKEKVDITATKVEHLENEVTIIKTVLKNTNTKINKLDKRFIKLESKVDRLEKKIDKISQSLASVQDDVQIIKGNLKQKVDIEEFNALEKRVILLERKT